ncbi:MAG: hypothetical protein IJD77_00245 [Clostridia bacterium]|nr:hypothetical protein [Clostridia bacterium]
MHRAHVKNTVRYYIVIIALLVFLFFSNDFGLLDVQKTAIITAAGIDREGDEFIVTSQLAIPQSSSQGKQTQSVQIVSRGKTIADAFDQINAKTGWYPKLVFCNLIVLGKETTAYNVFDALDFFLLDEYLSDDCLVATCDGLAKDILNTQALVDPSSSVAISKVLSAHAMRVGSTLPVSLREFASGYFSDSSAGYLPILKTEPQQEEINQKDETSQNPDSDSSQNGKNGSSGESSGQNTSSEQGNSSSSQSSESTQNGKSTPKQENKPVFSASETALFVKGKRVGKLNASESFAFSAVKNELRLAPYSVEKGENTCALNIKNNAAKVRLKVGKDGHAQLQIKLSLTAGLLDYSKALPLEESADMGDVPSGVFAAAEKKLAGDVLSTYEKCRSCGCDLFGARELLIKYKSRNFHRFANTLLENSAATVNVHFKNVR